MGKIEIKKKIQLDFLGEDYKEAYLEFRAIPLKEYEVYTKQLQNEKDDSVAGLMVIDILDKQFMGGEFPDEKGEMFKVEKDQLKDFDIETAIKVFQALTGQIQDPK